MKGLLAFFSAYFYPQRIFSISIVRDLKNKTNLNKKDTVLIDAPCGFGETTAVMADKLGCKVTGYDISENAIKTAKQRYTSGRAQFICSDIITALQTHNEIDVMCIINSLFLITDYDKLLKEICPRLKSGSMMYVIVPNIKSPNYLFYKKQNPSVNILEFTAEQADNFFKRYGFEVISIEGIAFTSFYDKPILKRLSIIAHFILLALNFFKTQMGKGEPSYFLIKTAKVKSK
jgi:ubiquinone/menaquinone biosynthesis C-methylase UbiE